MILYAFCFSQPLAGFLGIRIQVIPFRFDEVDSVLDFHLKVHESCDKYNRVTVGYEIYVDNLSNSEANPTVTIAINGIKTAEKPDAWELRWVNEQTTIIIDGKKSTYTKFKKLKPHEYKKIYYYKYKAN